MEQIINSPMVQDAYKFNMQNVVFHHFNADRVIWTFKCRNPDAKFTPEMISEIRHQVDLYCSLRYTKDDLAWLAKNMPWLHADYIDFLSDWQPHRSDILINEGNIQAYNDCGLAIEAHGTELRTMMYEIPILAIVNEVYFAYTYGAGAKDIEFQKRTMEKFDKLRGGEYCIGAFSEFGLRRRYSAAMQDWLVKYIASENVPGFVGTSNVYLAKKYGVKPVGTMAHELFQLMEGHHEYNPAYVNRLVMKAWTKEYKTDNGIALTDCIGTDCFLLDFDKTYANLFSGVRHDSGDPIEWGDKILAHYAKLGIDATTKCLLFSDSLDFAKATAIKKHFNGLCKVAFGIGTYLSNPLDNPLNIVMKLTEVNGSPVAKISDTPGKSMCRDDRYVEYLKRCIEWRLSHAEER